MTKLLQTPKTTSQRVPEVYHIGARKLFFTFKSFFEPLGVDPFGDKQQQEDWMHDIAVMTQYDDLKHVTLELFDKSQVVHLRVVAQLMPSATGLRIVDSASGFELPKLPPGLIAGARTSLKRKTDTGIEQYRSLLRNSWSPITPLQQAPAARIESEHTAKITGGRQRGHVFISEASRRRLSITRSGPRYAFARDLESGDQNIWLHERFCDTPMAFSVGTHITAMVICTRRGLQARSIRSR